MLGLGFSGDSRIAPTGGFWRKIGLGFFRAILESPLQRGFWRKIGLGFFGRFSNRPYREGVWRKLGLGFFGRFSNRPYREGFLEKNRGGVFWAILESPLQGGVFGEKSGWGFLGDSRIAPTPKRRGPPERSRRGDTPTSSIAVTHRVLLMVLPPEIFLQRKPL
jgi:hypothetical protein